MRDPHASGSDPGPDEPRPPILDHPLGAPSVFSPQDLIAAVREQRGLARDHLPAVCVLDFDGDLTDALVKYGEATPCAGWPCFHTAMWTIEVEGIQCGLIPRTIGGPYAVLVAEQLSACGVRAILGLTSAGRLDPALPLPAIVIASRAIRDEGTSYHYLPPGDVVEVSAQDASILADELEPLGLTTRIGTVWTTDAPYRETGEQVERHRKAGALAVEMQAASLFAFAARRQLKVGLVAHLTNAPDHRGPAFDKGPLEDQRRIVHAICRAGLRIAKKVDRGSEPPPTVCAV
jgi:uridine phosphorylase